MKRIISMVVFFALVVTSMGQKTYYISSSTGNNSYNGLSETYNGKNGPWKTLSKVASHRFNIGDKILLNRGDTWSETLEISSNGISIGVYGTGSNPVINGANTVTGWTLHDASKNIWVAPLNTTTPVTQVFVNGVRQTIARWPNKGWNEILETSSNNTILRSNKLTQPLNYWQGSRIVYRYYWAFTEATVMSSSSGFLTMTGAPDDYNPINDWGFYIEGKFEELDSPGEYYWDNLNKLLYLALHDGENANNQVIEASVRRSGINSNIKSNVTIRNISIRNAALSGIIIMNCSDIQIINCTIENSKQYGVLIRRTSGTSLRHTIENCTITQVDGGGGGRFAAGISVEGNISSLNILKNNVSDVSSDTTSPRWGTGIYIGAGVNNSIIEGNYITRTSNNGIHLARLSGPNRVAYNTIHDCITLLDDAGGIYVNGDQTGTIIEYNTISDCVGSREGAPANYVPLTMGLYSDAFDNLGTLYRGNIVSGCTYGALIHMSKNTTLYNNTFYNNGHGIYLSEKGVNEMSGNVIKNNICVAANSSQFPITIIRHSRSNTPIGIIDYNLYHNTTNNIAVRYGISSTNANNLTLTQWKNKTGLDSGNDANSINSDPKFLDANSVDFQLSEQSPCIDAGTDVGLLKDIIGTPIPKGNSPDIGAHEYFFFKNTEPEANAGTNQTVYEGMLVALDGSSSTDPDGDVISYQWTAPIGIVLSSYTTSKPTFIAPEVMVDTEFTFSLMVNDGNTDSQPSIIMVMVKNVNKAPISYAGNNLTVNEGEIVNLNGADSYDPDSYIITFHWTAPEGINLSSPTSPNPFFTAPEVTENIQYTFTLVVNDGLTDSQPAQVTITVLNVNKPPVADAGTNQTINEGESVVLDGSASFDPDNDEISFRWTSPDGIQLSSVTSAKPVFIAPEVTSDTIFTISLVVNDGQTDSEPSLVYITVVNVNKPPVANSGNNQTVYEGESVILDGSASFDPDNDVITFRWKAPDAIQLSSVTSVYPVFVAPEVTSDTVFTISVVVNDGQTDSEPSLIFITVVNVNKPPVANAGTDQTVNEGDMVYLDGSASFDQDNDEITFRWIAPEDIQLSSVTSANPAFVAPEVTADTVFTISLVVNDGQTDSEPSLVYITVVNVNKPPVANSGNNQTVYEGESVILDGSASFDPDNDEITFRWTTPDGIQLSSATSANPAFVAPEVTADTIFTISLVVNDGQTDSEPSLVFITIVNVNKPPVANAGNNQTVSEGDMVNLDGSASFDPDNDEITFRWTTPDGIQLSSATSANPAFVAPEVTADTTFTISLVVNDGQTNSDPTPVFITVINVNKPPVAKAGINQTVIEGEMVYLDGSSSYDPDNDEIVYRWESPVGFQFYSVTTAAPSFIAPTFKSDTTVHVFLTVNDGQTDSDPDSLKITIIRNFKKRGSFDNNDLFAILYPNPASSILNIILTKDFCVETTISIFDILGNICFMGRYDDDEKITIDTSAFINGFYTVLIKCEKVLQIEKLIIQS